MIQSIKHKGLKLQWEQNDPSKISPTQVDKIRRILTTLNIMKSLDPLRQVPGYRLHALKGDFKGYYAVSVTGNYCIIFRFESEIVYDIDYLDYH